MKAEKLFRFVHSLTKQQKSNFTRSLKGDKKTLEILLYERILIEPEFSLVSERRIRGAEFSKSDKYYIYRDRLRDRILDNLVSTDTVPNSTAIIRIAIEQDIPEVATQVLSKAIKILSPSEDFLTIKYILEYCSQLETRLGITIKNPENALSGKYLNDRLAVSKLQQDLLDLIKRTFRVNANQRFSVIQRVEKAVWDFIPLTNYELFKFLKIKVGIQWLKNDWASALEIQESLAEKFIKDHSVLSEWEKVKETTLVITFAKMVGNHSKATYYLMKFEKLNFSTIRGQNAKLYQSALDHISLGAQYADLKLLEYGLEILDSHEDLFEARISSDLHFFVSLTYFSHRKYSQALDFLSVSRKIKPVKCEGVSWEIEVLFLLIHFELGNVDLFDSLARSAYRKIKQLEFKYPQLIVSTIKGLSNIGTHQEKDFLTSKLIEFEELMTNYSEKNAIKYWDFTIWIKSRLESVSQANYIQQRERIRQEKPRKSDAV